MATRRLANRRSWQPSQPPGTEHDGVPGTSHHITPHHIAAPQREFGCRIPQWNMYASWAWAGQSTNTNTIPNDGNDILAKVQTQVPPTSNNSAPHGPFGLFECADDRQ
jgi:hypothetical protein